MLALLTRRESSRHQGNAVLTGDDVITALDCCLTQKHTWLSTVNWSHDWTAIWASLERIHGEHTVSGFVLCLVYHFTLQIEALCLYTFHPVLSHTAGLSGQLITAAIHQRNQSVNHCESQTVRGNDSKELKPKSALFVSCVFLAVDGEESPTLWPVICWAPGRCIILTWTETPEGTTTGVECCGE